MKQCTKCGIQKPLSEFYKDKRTKDKHRNCCNICSINYHSLWNLKNKEYKASHTLLQKYGITLDDKKSMINKQNNLCEICKSQLLNTEEACVDHCHTTGKIRDILCRKCNSLLGQAKDSTQILKSAILYLDKHANKDTK
jgi:hypothetical protein